MDHYHCNQGRTYYLVDSNYLVHKNVFLILVMDVLLCVYVHAEALSFLNYVDGNLLPNACINSLY